MGVYKIELKTSWEEFMEEYWPRVREFSREYQVEWYRNTSDYRKINRWKEAPLEFNFFRSMQLFSRKISKFVTF